MAQVGVDQPQARSRRARRGGVPADAPRTGASAAGTRKALLAVELESADGRRLTTASYHAYAGEKGEDGLDKPRLTSEVAAWLAHVSGPTILAMDANSPWVDHPDPELVECCFDRPGARDFERGLLHPADKAHRLQDVLRTWLDTNPDELERVRAERPAGPVAISHRTGRNASRLGNPRRYDHIYAPSDFEVVDVRYLYDEAIQAGSDHALVTAALISGDPTGPR